MGIFQRRFLRVADPPQGSPVRNQSFSRILRGASTLRGGRVSTAACSPPEVSKRGAPSLRKGMEIFVIFSMTADSGTEPQSRLFALFEESSTGTKMCNSPTKYTLSSIFSVEVTLLKFAYRIGGIPLLSRSRFGYRTEQELYPTSPIHRTELPLCLHKRSPTLPRSYFAPTPIGPAPRSSPDGSE